MSARDYQRGRAAAFAESAELARTMRASRIVKSGVKDFPATPGEIARVLDNRAHVAEHRAETGE